ncbi:MAG TPA: metallophosphoesterase [Thermoleophilaceae bacterium]|jgi:predicted phosphodiesterase
MSRRLLRVRQLLAIAAVVVAAFGGALAAFSAYTAERDVSVGTVELSIEPFDRGALDLYAPIVDWGVRFPVVRMPARVKVDVRSVDREAIARVAEGGQVDVDSLRDDAEDAIASYLRELIAIVLAAALLMGSLAALALRSREAARLRWLLLTAVLTAAAITVALVVLLPPRGDLDDPEYYAHGSDIPRALEAVEAATSSPGTLAEELNAQLVGLARLVIAPSGRPLPGGLPRLTLASDLHNNVLTLPSLEGAARGGPLLFAGDLTDQGRPFEIELVRRVVSAGRPFLFVTGNHDSDTLVERLVREGAIVLTERGRVQPDGGFGPVVFRFNGIRVAGYSDRNERSSARRYRSVPNPRPTEGEQRSFATWLRGIRDDVDVVMVHAPELAEAAIERMRSDPPDHPLVLAVGHTHRPAVEQVAPNVMLLNGGTAGAGGSGNLAEGQPIGLAVLTYQRDPSFAPVVADLVEIDPGDGSARAERRRLPVLPGG